MLWIAAAALAAPMPHPVRWAPQATVQATAMIRILSGVRLTLNGQPNTNAPRARESSIRADGAPQRAILIEFE